MAELGTLFKSATDLYACWGALLIILATECESSVAPAPKTPSRFTLYDTSMEVPRTTHIPPLSPTHHKGQATPPVMHSTSSATVIEPLDFHHTKDLEGAFQDIHPYFDGKETEHNWTYRETSLIKLRRITSGNAPNIFKTTYLTGIKGLLDGILKTSNSLRTTPSNTGCYLVQDIAVKAGSGIDNMVEIMLQSLIKLCAATKKISSQNGNTTVNSILANVSFTPRLVQHISNASQDKNVQLRTYAAGWLKTIIDTHGHHKHVLEHGGSLEIIEKIIRNGLSDANPGVRGSMRSAFWAFASISAEKCEGIMLSLDEKHQSLLVADPSNPNPGKTVISTSAAPGKSGETSQSTKPTPLSLKETIATKKRAKEAELKAPNHSSIESNLVLIADPLNSNPGKTIVSTSAETGNSGETSKGTKPAPPSLKETITAKKRAKAVETKAQSHPYTESKSLPAKFATSRVAKPASIERKATSNVSRHPSTEATSTIEPKANSTKATGTMSSAPVRPLRPGKKAMSADLTKSGPKPESSLVIPAATLSQKLNALTRPTISVSSKVVSKVPSRKSSSGSNRTRKSSTGSSSRNEADLTYRPSVQKVPLQSIPPVDLDTIAPGFDSPAKQRGWRKYEAEERLYSLSVDDVPNQLAARKLRNLISQLEARTLGLGGFRDLQEIIRNHHAICGVPATFKSIMLLLQGWLVITDDHATSSAIILTLQTMADHYQTPLIPYHFSIVRSVLTARKHYAQSQPVVNGMYKLANHIVEACNPEAILGELVNMLQAISEPEAVETIVMGLLVAADLVHRLKQITSQSIIERTGSYAASCLSNDKPTEIRESGIKLATELSVWVTEEAFWKIFAQVHEGTKGLLRYYLEKLKRELQEE